MIDSNVFFTIHLFLIIFSKIVPVYFLFYHLASIHGTETKQLCLRSDCQGKLCLRLDHVDCLRKLCLRLVRQGTMFGGLTIKQRATFEVWLSEKAMFEVWLSESKPCLRFGCQRETEELCLRFGCQKESQV